MSRPRNVSALALGSCLIVFATDLQAAKLIAGGGGAGAAIVLGNSPAIRNSEQQTNSCLPGATFGDDVISCVGSDVDGVDGQAGNDVITIVAGASVGSLGVDPQAQTTVVEGGDGNDTINNDGEVVGVVVSVRGSIKPSPPADEDTDTETEQEGPQPAQATGIHGGSGDDTVDNTGSVSATAVTTTPSLTIGIGGASIPIGQTTTAAKAVGIDGGGDVDTLINSGNVNATATAVAANLTGTANIALSTKDSAIVGTATSVGMEGGSGPDTLTNSGNVTAVSTAVVGVESGSFSGVFNSLAPPFGAASSHKAEATATGLAGGEGADTISNTDDVTAVATAGSGSLSVDIRTANSAKALSTSTATSNAMAVDAGGGRRHRKQLPEPDRRCKFCGRGSERCCRQEGQAAESAQNLGRRRNGRGECNRSQSRRRQRHGHQWRRRNGGSNRCYRNVRCRPLGQRYRIGGFDLQGEVDSDRGRRRCR